MDQERWKKIKPILEDAMALGPTGQTAFLRAACGGDDALLYEVREMLDLQTDDDLLERPAHAHLFSTNGRSKPGEQIDKYRIISELGVGGMGVVYLAERVDGAYTQKVALKVIKDGIDSAEILNRFYNERQILASLQHDNIAHLIDGGTTSDGRPFLAMEYIEGVPVTQYVSQNGLGLEARLKLFAEICSAVSFAHKSLVIHRDLKPSNILVNKDGVPKLLDFGIAKLLATGPAEPATATQRFIFTPEYASPEQVRGEKLTTATDVYSLGIIFYELLTGRRPYSTDGSNISQIIQVVCDTPPTAPSRAMTRSSAKSPVARTYEFASKLKGDLDNIVLKTLRKEPERRYSSVEQLSEDIGRYLNGQPVSASADSWRYRTGKFIKRNRLAAIAAAVVFITLVSGIVATAWQAHRAQLQSQRATDRFNQVRTLAHAVLFDYHDAIATLPGSTAVRERLVKDALSYLDELAGDPDNNVSLQCELAAAYLKVGDVQGRPYSPNLGQSDGALQSYRKALAAIQPLAESYPADKEIAEGLANVYERLGNMYLRNGDWEAASENNTRALSIRNSLLADDPTNRTYLGEVADSKLYVGDAIEARCSDVECLHEALDLHQQALNMRLEMLQETPADIEIQRSVARAEARVGFRLEQLGSSTKEKNYFSQWLATDMAALAIRRSLVNMNPNNATDRRNLADQLMLTANAQVKNEDITSALKNYNESLQIFRALSSGDPGNSEALRDMGNVYYRLATLNLLTGNEAEAHRNFDQDLKIVEQLSEKDPANEEDTHGLIAIFNQLSDLSKGHRDFVGSIAAFKKVVEIYERKVSSNPEDPIGLQNLAYSYSAMGVHYLESLDVPSPTNPAASPAPSHVSPEQARKWKAAREWFQKSLDIYNNLKTRGILDNAYAESSRQVEANIAKCDAAIEKARVK